MAADDLNSGMPNAPAITFLGGGASAGQAYEGVLSYLIPGTPFPEPSMKHDYSGL